MKIKLFENFDQADLDIIYELWTLDNNGDEEEFHTTVEDISYNPYDLTDMVKLFMKYEKIDRNLFIKKITTEVIDNETIKKVKLSIEEKKYNI
jgi:hypothetical protein